MSKLFILKFCSGQFFFWGPAEMRGNYQRLFHWFSSNFEVEATWTSLIGWPHKTSSTYVYMPAWLMELHRKLGTLLIDWSRHDRPAHHLLSNFCYQCHSTFFSLLTLASLASVLKCVLHGLFLVIEMERHLWSLMSSSSDVGRVTQIKRAPGNT